MFPFKEPIFLSLFHTNVFRVPIFVAILFFFLSEIHHHFLWIQTAFCTYCNHTILSVYTPFSSEIEKKYRI